MKNRKNKTIKERRKTMSREDYVKFLTTTRSLAAREMSSPSEQKTYAIVIHREIGDIHVDTYNLNDDDVRNYLEEEVRIRKEDAEDTKAEVDKVIYEQYKKALHSLKL